MKRYDIDTHYCEHDGSSWGIAVSSPTGEYVRFDDLPPEPQWVDKPDEQCFWWNEHCHFPVYACVYATGEVLVNLHGSWTPASKLKGRWTRCIKPSPPN